MKKTKLEKGITLIALIITIVVLLILAVVAIGAVQESGIIAHAQNAASGYNTGKVNEESAILGYETLIESNLPGGNGESGNQGGSDDGENEEITPPIEEPEEILWAFLDWEDDEDELYFIGNVTELDLSQDKEVKAYVATFNDDTEEPEYNESSEVTTVRLSDTSIKLDRVENASMQKLILGAEIYEYVGHLDHLNSKIVILENGITSINKKFDGNNFIESIEIPSTVTSISNSFYACTNLTNITIKKAQSSLDLSSTGLTEAQIASIVWAP